MKCSNTVTWLDSMLGVRFLFLCGKRSISEIHFLDETQSNQGGKQTALATLGPLLMGCMTVSVSIF